MEMIKKMSFLGMTLLFLGNITYLQAKPSSVCCVCVKAPCPCYDEPYFTFNLKGKK